MLLLKIEFSIQTRVCLPIDFIEEQDFLVMISSQPEQDLFLNFPDTVVK